MSFHAQADRGVDVPLAWVEFDEVPILFANHFLVQHQPEEFVVTLGQVTGPPLVGTPEQVNEQIGQLTRVPINTLARVAVSRHRVTELISLLQAAVEEHDRAG
jgi:hypothetical protein